MRTLALCVAAVTAMATMTAPTFASAQNDSASRAKRQKDVPAESADPAAAAAKGRERGMAEAPALMAQTGRSCTVEDANYLGAGKNTIDGKQVNVALYEVACGGGLGYILIKPDAGNPTANDCLQYATAAASAKDPAKATQCKLPANANPAQGLQPLIASTGQRCAVAKARWVGFSPTAKVNQYEVGCQDNTAYLLTAPVAGSDKKLAVDSCLKASAAGVACEYQTKEQITAQIASMAAPANRAQCQVTQARFVGNTNSGSSYYEVGCSNDKAGFIFETDVGGRFVRAVDCGRAAGIGGGCTFTDAVVAENEQAGVYGEAAAKVGYQCTVSQYRLMGLDKAGREVVELACTNDPVGAIVLLPLKAEHKGEVHRCPQAKNIGGGCKLSQAAPARN